MNILGSGFLHITDKLTSSSFKSTSLLPDWLVVGFWLRIVHNRSHILILLLTTFLCWYLHLGLCDHVRPHGSVEEVLCRSALWKERFCTEESSQGWWGSTRLMLTEHINLSGGPLTVYLCVLPGLWSSLRLEGESMRSRASAASIVLSEQWTLVPWTEASTATHRRHENSQQTLAWTFNSWCFSSLLSMRSHQSTSFTFEGKY